MTKSKNWLYLFVILVVTLFGALKSVGVEMGDATRTSYTMWRAFFNGITISGGAAVILAVSAKLVFHLLPSGGVRNRRIRWTLAGAGWGAYHALTAATNLGSDARLSPITELLSGAIPMGLFFLLLSLVPTPNGKKKAELNSEPADPGQLPS